MQELKLIYDFGEEWPRLFPTIIFFIPFCISIGAFFYYKKQPESKEKGRMRLPLNKEGKIASLIVMIFTGLISIAVINPIDFILTKRIYHSDELKSVEGVVENYHPMPADGHDTEYFDVDGVHFEYSDFAIGSYEYNNAASRGGAIRAGLHVRIHYYNSGYNYNHILKLETE